jgi:hypothetical protein
LVHLLRFWYNVQRKIWQTLFFYFQKATRHKKLILPTLFFALSDDFSLPPPRELNLTELTRSSVIVTQPSPEADRLQRPEVLPQPEEDDEEEETLASFSSYGQL